MDPRRVNAEIVRNFASALEGARNPASLENGDSSIGNLHLTNQEDNDLVAFFRTLADGYDRVAAPGEAIGASIRGASTGPSL